MRLPVMLMLILMKPLLVAADECTDACDGELASQLASCQVDYDNRFGRCESQYFSETDLCQSCVDFANETHESCLASCEPVPSAERSFSTLKHRYE